MDELTDPGGSDRSSKGAGLQESNDDQGHDATRAALQVEARRVEEGLKFYELTHRITMTFWNRVHLSVGLVGIGLAAAASSAEALDAGTAAVSLALATGASLTTASLIFLSPKERAEAHRRAALSMNSLRGRVRRFREISVFHLTTKEAANALETLVREKDHANSLAPGVSGRTFRKAKKSIDAGIFEYEVDHLGNLDDEQ